MKKFKIKNHNQLKLLKTIPLVDNRGFFQRIYCNKELKKILKAKKIKQINHSYTKKRGTIRGLHMQVGSFSEIKIIKCIKGKIFDVSVNMIKKSKNYLRYKSIVVSDKDNRLIIIPEGHAHGFQSITNNVEIIYFVTQYYSKNHEKSFNPLDPKIKIKWPITKKIFLSKKDKNALLL
jgi:dTDP-4-dehydrorhamnose 3,5-epimerase